MPDAALHRKACPAFCETRLVPVTWPSWFSAAGEV
jgi:hypothetical protein